VLDGLVYIVGAGGLNNDVLRFDPASGVWTTLTLTSLKRWLMGASFVLDGCVYVAGGETGDSDVERYDVATNTWTCVMLE
jgi:hypothetical protein